MWPTYHATVTRTLIILLFLTGSAGLLLIWIIRRPVLLVFNLSDWADDRLIDLEESIYEHTWVARGRLPAWKDE